MRKIAIENIFVSVFAILIFPITGLVISVLYTIEAIKDLHEINKEIKEEKLEKIIEKIIERRKETNNDYKKEEI